MKKLFSFILISSLLTIIFVSCNKDDTVSPGGGTPTPTIITQTYTSNPDKNILPNTMTADSLNANITTGINANNVADVKLNLNTLEGVIVSNLKFALFHNDIEILLIDNLTNISGQGNISNLVLSDSATTSVMTLNGYPITGTYRPLNPLSGFDNTIASGYWTLKVYNSGSYRTGVIKSWGITITYTPIQPPPSQIYPLSVGNYWITEVRNIAGYVINYDTAKILYSTTYQGKTMYGVYNSSFSTQSDSILVCIQNDGLWAYNLTQNWSQLIYKYPISVGEIYLGGGNGDTVKCLSISDTITTPSGFYSGCIKLEKHDEGHIVEYEYIKPGLGSVGYIELHNSFPDRYGRLYTYRIY